MRFKQQKFGSSQFWRPEVQDQGVYRARLPLKALREEPEAAPLVPSGVAGVSLQSRLVHVSVCKLPSLLGCQSSGQGPSQSRPHFHLLSAKTLPPNQAAHTQCWGLGRGHTILRVTIQPSTELFSTKAHLPLRPQFAHL